MSSTTPKELAKFVRALCKIEGSDQEVFSRPDVIRLVCIQTLKIVLNVDMAEVQPPFGATDHELHRESLQELAFIKYATRMCIDFGIDFEPTRDLYSHNPDPRRVQYILARIVNFLNFREREVATYVQKWGVYMNTYSALSDKMEQLKPQNDADESSWHLACERRAQTEAKVEALQREIAKAETEIQPRIASHKALEKRFEDLRAGLAEADRQLGETRQQTSLVQAECSALRALVDEPPEKLREAVLSLRRAIDSQKAELAALDLKANHLGTRKASLLKIDATLEKCIRKLKEMEDLRTRYKQIKKTSKEKEAECNALEDQKEKAEKKVNVTKGTKLPAIQEREVKLQMQREQRQSQFSADLERAKEQRKVIDAEVAALRQESLRMAHVIEEMQQTAATNCERHMADAARVQEAIDAVAKQVEEYHEEIFASMEAAVALEHY